MRATGGRGRRLPGWAGPAVAATLGTLGALALLLGAAEAFLRFRPLSREERNLRDEGVAYGRLIMPAQTPRLAGLGWVALRRDTSVQAGALRRETNNLGFRDLPHPASKPAGVFRLVVIGDSYVYGQGIDRVTDIFPHRLGLDRIGGRPLEVVLMGYCGADLLLYNAMFQELAFPLEPDAVLLSLVSNDLENRTAPPAPCLPAGVAALLRATPRVRAEAERRCNVLTRHYERQLVRQFDTGTESFRKERAALAEMKDVADRRGIDLLAFFFHPRPDPLGMDSVFRDLTASLEIPYASLVPAAERLLEGGMRPADFDVSRFDGHPNERAHALAAEVVTGLLRARYPASGGAAATGTAGGASAAGGGPRGR